MIYVSQGHAKGIGLEVFFNAFRSLTKFDQNQIVLFLTDQLTQDELNYYQIDNISKAIIKFKDSSELKIHKIKASTTSTMDSLIAACSACESDGSLLFTLPSSKDQFVQNGHTYAGHTAYFKHKYTSHCTMMFYSDFIKMILMTEHVALNNVVNEILNIDFNYKFKIIFDSLKKFNFFNPDRLIFSGINPHCGEDGLLGTEEDVIHQFIRKQGKNYSAIGPIAADTLSLSLKPNDLAVFFHHDQGLGYFKSNTGFYGLNISLGLPFLRVSVDHGTAFNLYGKNTANYSSCLYGLNFCLKQLKKRDKQCLSLVD